MRADTPGTHAPKREATASTPDASGSGGPMRVDSAPAAALEVPAFDPEAIRRDFPIFRVNVHEKPLVYLDNAATTQKPQAVVERMARYYFRENANIHRGVHFLSEQATRAYEDARARVRDFLGAEHAAELIFVRGTTEALNLVASSWGRSNVSTDDEVVLTAMEHHSNIVPWQMLCDTVGARLRVAPIDDQGDVEFEGFSALLNERTKIVTLAHVSNALGTINPLREMIREVRQRAPHAVVVIDGAQAGAHVPIDVRELDCDFYALSAHKMYGPTGVGALYGRKALLEAMPPYQGGGDMILSVSFERTTYNRIPHKFEAGTPNIAGVIGFGAAIEYLTTVGVARAATYEDGLLHYATERLRELPDLRLIGTAARKAAVASFLVGDIHPHDVGTILDQHGVAIRAGHHCAQPVMERFGVPATVRASFGFYNTRGDVDALIDALVDVQRIFA